MPVRRPAAVKKAAAKPVDYTFKNPETLAKYKTAGEVSAKALAHVKSLAVVGAKIVDIVAAGDAFIEEELAKVYPEDKKLAKGIAFPTSVSPNNVVAHYSPLKAEKEEDDVTLKAGDVVKIALGAQVDGFAAVLADTIALPDADGKISARVADTITAAWNAAEAALRTVKAGNKNSDVTKIVDDVVKDYECAALEGMLSHQLDRNDVEAGKEIILNPSESHKRGYKTHKFGPETEAYGIDVLVSSGDGKVRQSSDLQTTIYRKAGTTYSLKLQSSRNIFSEITKKSGAFPHSIRNTADIKKARLGLKECTSHNLLVAYDVVEEKAGQVVAQFFSTIVITPEGTIRVAGPTEPDFKTIASEKRVTDEKIAKLLAEPL